MAADPRFKTGCTPTPQEVVAASSPFTPFIAAHDKYAHVPARLSVWANDRYGVCVTSESAFAAACARPLIMITEDEVIRWARQRGILNGAYLEQVLRWMREDGLKAGSQIVGNDGYYVVDYRDEEQLKSAICLGPVSIAIASASLPSSAGNQQGWYQIARDDSRATDHCVSLCGHGPAKWLYEQLGVPLPAAVPADMEGYLLFTWGTIGFVTHAWLMGTCVEAWVRNPTNVVKGTGPIPANPGPPHSDDPPPPPPPPPGGNQLVLSTALPAGTYSIGGGIPPGSVVLDKDLADRLRSALAPGADKGAPPLLTLLCTLYHAGMLSWLPAPVQAVLQVLCSITPQSPCSKIV